MIRLSNADVRLFRRASVLASAALIVGAGCDASTRPQASLCDSSILPSEAVITIAWRDSADDMHVLVRNANTVKAACDYIAGRSSANIPAGRIAVGEGPADPRVPFHYVPETVQFVQVAIELCDSALLRTMAAVETYFAGTGSSLSATAPFCPWGAAPVNVRSAP